MSVNAAVDGKDALVVMMLCLQGYNASKVIVSRANADRVAAQRKNNAEPARGRHGVCDTESDGADVPGGEVAHDADCQISDSTGRRDRSITSQKVTIRTLNVLTKRPFLGVTVFARLLVCSPPRLGCSRQGPRRSRFPFRPLSHQLAVISPPQTPHRCPVPVHPILMKRRHTWSRRTWARQPLYLASCLLPHPMLITRGARWTADWPLGRLSGR